MRNDTCLMNDAVKKYNVVGCHKSLFFFLGHSEATGYGYAQCKIQPYLPEEWEVKTLEGLMLSWVVRNKCRGFVVKKASFH